MAEKEKRSLRDELRFVLSSYEKVRNKDWDGFYDGVYNRDTGSESEEPAAETDSRIAERAHDRLYQQKGAEGVFESVADKFQPKTVPVKTETPTVLPEGTGGTENMGPGETDGMPDVEVNGYIEALRGILDPNYAARASEDVMGQYAAMTGGRPSSAAISAGTAARADAEAALLRELLSGGDTQNGESGGLLSGLLGENATTGEMDVPEEYAGYADLPSYETIVPMLESFESEEDMGDYLADMFNKGLISEADAIEYLKRFDDPYEEYDAGGRIDYAAMVKNPGGWTLTDEGGTNFFGGLNRNMRIKSPNGQEFTVAQLYRLLKKNGMDEQEAKNHLVKLQNYLKSKE